MKQELKSKETKEKIFQAAIRILQRNGYENLSIKNICEEAGVSNGSFYHHFKTKDDLLSYYIEAQPAVSPNVLDLPKDAEDAKDAIVQVYLDYADYCKKLGVDFVAGYYNPKNQALNPLAIKPLHSNPKKGTSIGRESATKVEKIQQIPNLFFVKNR